MSPNVHTVLFMLSFVVVIVCSGCCGVEVNPHSLLKSVLSLDFQLSKDEESGSN